MFLNRGQKALDEDWPRSDGDYYDQGGEGGGGGIGSGAGSGGGKDSGRGNGNGTMGGRGGSSTSTRHSRSGDGIGAEGAWPGGAREKEAVQGKEFLYCINLVRKQDDPTARRGARVKAMCVCSRYNFIEVRTGVFHMSRR